MEEIKINERGRQEIRVQGDTKIEVDSDVLLVLKCEENGKIEFDIKEGSKVKTFLIQDANDIEKISKVGEEAKLESYCLWTQNGKGNAVNVLEGKMAEATDTHVFLQDKEKRFHLNAKLEHVKEDTRGDVLVKGLVQDNAKAELDGMIKIRDDGRGAESQLKEYVMLLNEGARARANPELEIENNDVISSHAASVSQISEEDLFYLMSRGLERERAKDLIIRGFMESAINKIEEKDMREKFLENTIREV